MKKGFLLEVLMQRRMILLAFLLFLIFVLSYAQFQKYEYGIISWYGEEFAGKKTANGEVYDPQKLTAAHRIYPFGTLLEVENLENGKKVTVRVNDRGPYAANRILDVSKKAAETLGFLKRGTVYARLTLIKLGDNKVVDIFSEENQSSSDTVQSQSSVSATSLPKSEESFKSSASAEMKMIITTNVKEFSVTNKVVVTNYVPIPVTNVIDMPPYQEKIVESNIDTYELDTNVPDINDQFIMEEPPVFPESEKPFEKKGGEGKTNVYTVEKEITPEDLLSNETVIQFEDKPAKIKDEGVRVERISPGEIWKEEVGVSYVVQAGAFNSERYALRLYNLLRSSNYDVFTTENVVKGKRWIRVRVGYFSTAKEAREVSEKIRKYKVEPIVIKIKK